MVSWYGSRPAADFALCSSGDEQLMFQFAFASPSLYPYFSPCRPSISAVAALGGGGVVLMVL